MPRTSDGKEDEPDKKGQLWNRLQSTQTPFNWDLPEPHKEIETYINNQKAKCEVIDEDNQFEWTRFVSRLILSYELCKMHNYTEALECIIWCQAHWNSLSDCKEPLFCDVKEVLAHVILATKARILLSAGKDDLAEKVNKSKHKTDEIRKQILHQFPIRNNMTCYVSKEVNLLENCSYGDVRGLRTKRNRAGLLGLKAATYMQYTAGYSKAIEFAKGAKTLDPDQAEWWFIIGVALGKLRRRNNKRIYPEISKEEIESIEKAFTLQKDASYTVYLAEVYADSSKIMASKKHTERSKCYVEKAEMRYREALKLRPNCISLKARVAHGLLMVHSKDPIVKTLLEEVVAAAPNRGSPYADLQKYYNVIEKDVQKAIFYGQKAFDMGTATVTFYLTLAKWNNGYEHKIIDDLKKGLTIYKHDVVNQAMLYAYLGTCYLLLDDDWGSAIASFQRSLELDPSAKSLENFRGFDYKFANLLDIVTNHLQFNPIDEIEDQVNSFLSEVARKRPQQLHIAKMNDYVSWKRKVISKKMCRPVGLSTPNRRY